MALLDRVIFNPAQDGAADFIVASAVKGYQTPSQANAVNGSTYHYAAEIRNSAGTIIDWEVGTGTWASATNTLARTSVLFSSNSGSKVNFSNPPQVMITMLAEDLGPIGLGTGTDTCILFDKAGVVGEDTNLEWDYTNRQFKVNTGASSTFIICRDGLSTTYNLLSLNGSTTEAGNNFLGLLGGDPTDPHLYFETPTGGGHAFLIGNATPLLVDVAFGFRIARNFFLGWNTTNNNAFGSASSLAFGKADDNNLALANLQSLTTASGFQVYKTADTFPGPINYERGVFDWTTTPNVLTIGTQAGGSGSARNIKISPAGGIVTIVGNSNSGDTFKIDASTVGSSSYANFWMIGNTHTYQIGLGNSAETFFGIPNKFFIYDQFDGRMMWVVDGPNQQCCAPNGAVIGWSVTDGTGVGGWTADTALSRASAGVLAVGNGTAGDISADIHSRYLTNIGPTTTFPGHYVRIATDSVNRIILALDSSDNPTLQFGPGGASAIDTGISRVAPVSSVPTLALGNGTSGDASATIKAKTKAGAPTASDVPVGTWVLIRDTSTPSTKLYYNNAGTLQSVTLV